MIRAWAFLFWTKWKKLLQILTRLLNYSLLQSVSFWCNYINYVQEFDPLVSQCTPAGISKARELFERALTAVGLHVAEGGKIWEAYREFEQAILLTIDEADTQVRTFSFILV